MTSKINKTVKLVSACVLTIFVTTGVGLAQDYAVKGQYAAPAANNTTVTPAPVSNNVSLAEVATASGNPQSGVVSNLCDPYFYENYYDQVYDLNYCDWDKIMSNK